LDVPRTDDEAQRVHKALIKPIQIHMSTDGMLEKGIARKIAKERYTEVGR
jgi:hypothetical protein